MKKLIVLTFCSIVSYAMDYEEQPHPEHQLQLIVRNKNTTSEEFKAYLEARPKLTEVTVTGHQMTSIPQFNIQFNGLRSLDVGNGTLSCSKTLSHILAMAPNLHICKLANNQLSVLWISALPVHDALSSLDCSNNQITDVDFTELRKKLPNLTNLNLSSCPLIAFNTKDLKATTIIPAIDLRTTQLLDTEKKEILKNAVVPCVVDMLNKGEKDCFVYSAVPMMLVPMMSSVPFLVRSPLLLSAGAIVPVILAESVGSMAFGFGSTYLGFLSCKSLKNRFKTVYKPLLDNANYSEEEVTTRYGRFVKYFPYFCALSKCCHAEDPEYAPLNHVDEE